MKISIKNWKILKIRDTMNYVVRRQIIKNLIFSLIILGFIAMIFSACDLNWDGEVTVTGGTKLPNWIRWVTWNDYYNDPRINGIDVIEISPKTPRCAEYIFRIKTYDSLVDILKVQCNCAKPCNHENIEIDENEVEKLLEKFDSKYFETKNLIVTELTGSVLTMNYQVNKIDKNGVINITETKRITFLPVEDLAISVTFAIEIDSSFVTPSSMSVSVKLK